MPDGNKIVVWTPITPVKNFDELAVPDLITKFEVWQEQVAQIKDTDYFREYQEEWVREWSIETGILERVYDLDRGITETLIKQGFDASFITHGPSAKNPENVIDILKDHEEAYDFLMDVVKSNRELTNSWIKELHQLLMRHQDSAKGISATGEEIEIPLIKGKWKKLPNNSKRYNGKIVEYCPPEQVASEMDNLIDYYHEIPNEYPEIKAAWIHHRFTQIHPFQDGNGRVARCLSSIVFIKAGGFPLVVQREERNDYFDKLETADKGDLKPLIDYFSDIQEKQFIKAINIWEKKPEYESFDKILDAIAEKVSKKDKTEIELIDGIMQMVEDSAAELLEIKVVKIYERLKDKMNISISSVEYADINEISYRLRTTIEKVSEDFEIYPLLDMNNPFKIIRLSIGGEKNIIFNISIQRTRPVNSNTGYALFIIEYYKNKEYEYINCTQQPFIFTYKDKIEYLQPKLEKWLDSAFLIAIAEWEKRI